MNKKIICSVVTGLLFIANSSYAAKGASQNGFFLGVESGSNNIKYTYGTNSKTASAVPFEIIAGARYYKGKMGVGAKTFASLDNYSNEFDNITVAADGLRFGGEGQFYFDIKQFSIKSKASSVGLTLGVGYEDIGYYSANRSTTVKNRYVTYKNYHDSGLYYTGALHFTVGPNRLEVGYKKVDYSKTSSKTSELIQNNPIAIGFNPTDTLFVAYSVSF